MKKEYWLCPHCIEEIRSRGERIRVGELVMTADEAEEEGEACSFCHDYEDLYEVAVD